MLDRIVQVYMDDAKTTGPSQILYSYGFGPCMGITLYDGIKQEGTLLHAAFLDYIEQFFERWDGVASNTSIGIAGGNISKHYSDAALHMDKKWEQTMKIVDQFRFKEVRSYRHSRIGNWQTMMLDCANGEITVNNYVAGEDPAGKDHYIICNLPLQSYKRITL